MKRETMEWIRREAQFGAKVDNPTQDERMAMDIDAELKRLRRIERAAQRMDDVGSASEELRAALKKGGRK